jgi:hypothetical protein
MTRYPPRLPWPQPAKRTFRAPPVPSIVSPADRPLFPHSSPSVLLDERLESRVVADGIETRIGLHTFERPEIAAPDGRGANAISDGPPAS